jgi:hypothetical protein
MEGWNDFFVAAAGTASVLAGLLFVGLSINLERLLRVPAVLMRASATIALLGNVLAISMLMLVPNGSLRRSGFELLVLDVGIAVLVGWLSLRSIRMGVPAARQGQIRGAVLRMFALAPLLIGSTLLIGENASGLGWLVPGVLLSFAATLIESWIVLVEINR